MKVMKPIKDITKVKQLKRTLKKRNYRDYLMFTIAINTPISINELLSLKVKDIKKRDFIEINSYKFYLNEELKLEIGEYVIDMDVENLMFESRNKGTLNSEQFYRIIRNAGKEIGLDIGLSTLRKTFAFHYFRETKDIKYVRKILNHQTIRYTFEYIDCLDEYKLELL